MIKAIIIGLGVISFGLWVGSVVAAENCWVCDQGKYRPFSGPPPTGYCVKECDRDKAQDGCVSTVITEGGVCDLKNPLYAPTPTLTSVNPEVEAIDNLSRGLIPEEVIDKEVDKDVFQQVQGWGQNLLTVFNNLFSVQPKEANKTYGQAKSLHQSIVPEELKPEPEGVDVITRIGSMVSGFLGGSTGFYGVTLPKFSDQSSSQVKINIQDTEKDYEKSYFPEGVCPVTGC